jgi:signal peptidase II
VRDVQAAGEPPLTEGAPDGAGALTTPAAPRRTRVVLALVAITVFVADLATKTWVVHHYTFGRTTTVISGVLQIELTRNAGAAFGIATGATVLFTIVAVAVITFIVRTAPKLRSTAWAVTLGLLLGGAVGNLGDRIFRSPGIFRGRVVDWIYLHHWPVFNLADSGIVIGGVLAVLLASQGIRPDGTRETREGEAAG